VLPHNEIAAIERSTPLTSSYSNFDYSGIKFDGTDAYKEEYGSAMEDSNSSSRLPEDVDDLRTDNYILAHSLTQDHENNEKPITSNRFPNYSAIYSRFICRNDHDSACERNKRVSEERQDSINHLLDTDKTEHIDLPPAASNAKIFRHRPSDEDRNTYERAYSVGNQGFSNKDVSPSATDSLRDEEYGKHKVNYALVRYKNKFPGKGYRIKVPHYNEHLVAGLPGVRLKYNEGIGKLYSMEGVSGVDTARKGMRNKAKNGNEVPKIIRFKDGTGDVKISRWYIPHNSRGKYDIRNTKKGRSENQQQFYIQGMIHGGAEGKVLDKTDMASLAPVVNRRLEITPGYIYPTDNTNVGDKIVFLNSPKYQNYATAEQFDNNEHVNTNRNGEDRSKRSQTKIKSSSVNPTKSYPSHYHIFRTDTKFEQHRDPKCSSITSRCIERETNRDIPVLEPKNKLPVTRLHRNTQYLDDSDKYEGDSIVRSTTEHVPKINIVKVVKDCKYPVCSQSHEYHNDGGNLEAEEDMGSHQSILYPANGRNSFQTDNKFNHYPYSDVTFVRSDKIIQRNTPSILNTILNSVERNGDQGTKLQTKYDPKCRRINIGRKEIGECFAAQNNNKYTHAQRNKGFPIQENVKTDNNEEDSFVPGKYDSVLILQQNTGYNTETSAQNIANTDIYTRKAVPYEYFNHHRSDRSSSQSADLLRDEQHYKPGPQHSSQLQVPVGDTQQAADFFPIVKGNAGAEENPSRPLPQIDDEYFMKSIPQHFSPQGSLEMNEEHFPGNTINKEHLIRNQIRPSNIIKEEKTIDGTHYFPISYENAVNNVSANKDQAETILYGHTDPKPPYRTQDHGDFNAMERHENPFHKSLDTDKAEAVVRNLQIQEYNSDQVKDNVNPSEDVKGLDHWELDKNNTGIEAQRMESKLPLLFEPQAFLREEDATGEQKSEIGLKNDKLNADKELKTSGESLLDNIEVRYSQGHDYTSSSGMNLGQAELATNRLGNAEGPSSPELSDDALQIQTEESISKMTGKYGNEETNIFSSKNKNWGRNSNKVKNGVKLNDNSKEKPYLGINSEAQKIELKSKIKLPYDEDNEGRYTIQYNNGHNSRHTNSGLKSVGQSKTKLYYVEDREGRGEERSNVNHKSDYTLTSADDADGLQEGDKKWQRKNGIFRTSHKGGYANMCDGCIQELRDGRILNTNDKDQAMETALYSFNTHINTDGVAVPNTDVNYSQVPEYNGHSPDTSPNKHKFNTNKLEQPEISSLDHSDDAIQFQIEESMSKMLGDNKFTHTNSETINDINDYSTGQINALLNSNADDLKSKKIKLKNQIPVSCKKRMRECDQAQYSAQKHHKANNLNVAKTSGNKIFYDEGKEIWKPGYEPIYKRTSVEDATASSDKKIKTSLRKVFREEFANSEKYKAQTRGHEPNGWTHEHPVPVYNEHVTSRKQESDRRTGDLDEQRLSGRFYSHGLHPSSKALLDYVFDKEYQQLAHLDGKERLKTGLENPTAPEHFKGSKFPLVAKSKVVPSKTPNYENIFNLPSHNYAYPGTPQNYNEIKHYRHANHDDHGNYDYDNDNDYQQAINAENLLYGRENYEDPAYKVPFQNYHYENYSPNNRQRFYENPKDIKLHDHQTIVSAQKHKGHHIGQYNENGDDVTATHEKELNNYVGGIHYRFNKNNIQTNSPVSKLDKHIWKGKEGQSASPEHDTHSSKDNLQYKAYSYIDKTKRNEYYKSPYIAIKYFPANYYHYEEYYQSENPNLYQPHGRLQRSTEANPKHDLESDLELETQIQRPYEFATSFVIQQLSAGTVQNSTLKSKVTQMVSDVQI
jgi:hypothetical protein